MFNCMAEFLKHIVTLALRRTPYPGGAPANVAAALGRLGVKVGFVSALGNDDLAKQMLELLKGTFSWGPIMLLLSSRCRIVP